MKLRKKTVSILMAIVMCFVLISSPVKSEASIMNTSNWSVVYSSGGISQTEYNSAVYTSGGGYAAKCTGFSFNGTSAYVTITMPGHILNTNVVFSQASNNEISFDTVFPVSSPTIAYRAKLTYSSNTTNASAAGYVRGK